MKAREDEESGHKKGISSLSKSEDGSHFITGSLDKSAKVGGFFFFFNDLILCST